MSTSPKVIKRYRSTGKWKATYRSWHYRKKYGITLQQYDDMLEAQYGRCEICGGLPSNGRRFSVDHDHKTGRVRGLLCDACNHGIGNFRDNIEIIGRAIAYLTKER